MGLTGRQIYVIYFILKNAETRGKNYEFESEKAICVLRLRETKLV